MKEIPLTRGKVALVDDEDFENLSQFKWNCGVGDSVYARRGITTTGKRVGAILMHREIMKAKPGEEVDHINHDTLDNRKSNLRICSRRENGRNRQRVARSPHRFKGITRIKGGWVAQIRSGEKHIYLGLFPTDEIAARAYDKAATELFGDFASLNFPLTKEK